MSEQGPPARRGRTVHVVDALRTPIGRARGVLRGCRPDDLAARVIEAIFERNPALPADAVEDVIFGNVNQAGEDNRNVARMALLLAGLPVTVGGATVNRLCGSGLDAFLHAYRAIALGEAEVAIAGGVESMSRSPYVMARPEGRLPARLDLVDSTIGWRFVNSSMPEQWTISMGATAENLAERYAISRQRQDAFALQSHRRAVDAAASGRFDAELLPVTTAIGSVAADEGPRADTSLEALARLSPAFREGGSVTAGNSSSINDGAAAAVLASEEACRRYGLEPLATVLGGAVAGVAPDVMGIGPVPATAKLLGRLGLELACLDALELNEAFAAQTLAVLGEWGMPDDWAACNAEGGAIALGHPLGCSGVRLLATLLQRLRRRGGGRGLATMCIGVGQGIAVALEAA